MNKIVFCDIDGTLMDGFRGMMDVSDRTMYALQELSKQAYVILTSGRAKFMLPERLSGFKPSGYILSNGAYIECCGEVLQDHLFDREQVEFLRAYSHRTDGRFILINQHNLYVEDLQDRMVNELLSNLGIPRRMWRQETGRDAYNFMIEICSSEQMCSRFLEECGSRYSIKREYKYSAFDVNRSGDNKGDAVTRILDYVHLDSDDAYCFGDSANDLEMMRLVRCSVAMGNAGQPIKDAASIIADDVLADGFYKTLVQLALIAPQA